MFQIFYPTIMYDVIGEGLSPSVKYHHGCVNFGFQLIQAFLFYQTGLHYQKVKSVHLQPL